MSSKPKKKLEKQKTKKIKRSPIKQSYTIDEIHELKQKYNDIMYHLSYFLSEHNVYEAVPENVKILVFNSELNFREMIKVFIFEDIYCGLIYDPKLNNYLGLITTRDLMILYKYIIDNFPTEEISDFKAFLKEIFSYKRFSKYKGKGKINSYDSFNNINCDINIYKYLSNINYIDYLIYVKNIDYQKIHLYSVSLDDNLLETLQKINIKNIHRLLVEEDDKRKNNYEVKNSKEGQKIRNIEQIKKQIKFDNYKGTKKNSLTEKTTTTTTNFSDEENKSNAMIGKKDIIKKKNKYNNEDYYDDYYRSKDETRPYKNKKIKNDELKRENTLETIDVNETENNKEEYKTNRKIIIRKRQTNDEENFGEVVKRFRTLDSQENKTDDEYPRRLDKKKSKNKRKTTSDVEMDYLENFQGKTERIDYKDEVVIGKDGKKRIIRKKVVIKKVMKRKKTDVSDDRSIDEYKKGRPLTEREKMKYKNLNHGRNIFEYNDDTRNLRYTSEPTEELLEKEKYELPKIKMKRRSVKNRIRVSDDSRRESEYKSDSYYESYRNSERYEKRNNYDIMRRREEESIGKRYDYPDSKEITEKSESKEEINYMVQSNDNETNTEMSYENSKKDVEMLSDILSNANLEEMKNYIGIVTNETIFEYLLFNYYSIEMKEFNLSLNDLLMLGDIPLLIELNNGFDMREKAYNTFNHYLYSQCDIIPIFNRKEIEGFIYPKDFLYYIYNCESKQSLTNEEFLIHLYRDIDEEKPYGKNRIIYMELNDTNKGFYVKELFEKLDCSIEKKIVIYDPNYKNKLYLMSLKTIFKAIVEFQLNNNK